ncbi:MAG: META domain-containing protein [Bifidobacteriaceae bacterium]|jgi:heat shock protein HslJ|nr:META domain-containing protein [Bifidobacteriaceae bacterium]
MTDFAVAGEGAGSRRGGRRRLWVSGVTVVVVLAVGVGIRGWRADVPPSPGSATQERDLGRLVGDWMLTGLNTAGTEADPTHMAEVHLTLGHTSADGWTGCQAYATIYTASAWGVFATDRLGVTTTSCTGSRAEFAQTYLDAFSRASRWTLTDDGVLELRGGGVTLTYSRSPEPTPTTNDGTEATWAGTWRVVRIHAGGRDVDVAPDAGVWIGIASRRTTGNGGCNGFFGRVSTLGARGLFFDRLVLGLKACTGSDTVMRVESDLVDALASVDRWDLDKDGNLVLMGKEASVTLTRAGLAPAIDSPPAV